MIEFAKAVFPCAGFSIMRGYHKCAVINRTGVDAVSGYFWLVRHPSRRATSMGTPRPDGAASAGQNQPRRI